MGEETNVGNEFNTIVSDFLNSAAEDPRIGPTHISLFMAVLHFYKMQGYKEPISIYSKELMKHGKISAAGTYHQCIKQLHRYGFIYYIPSYNPAVGSLIYIIKPGSNENIHRTGA